MNLSSDGESGVQQHGEVDRNPRIGRDGAMCIVIDSVIRVCCLCGVATQCTGLVVLIEQLVNRADTEYSD